MTEDHDKRNISVIIYETFPKWSMVLLWLPFNFGSDDFNLSIRNPYSVALVLAATFYQRNHDKTLHKYPGVQKG